MVVSYKKLWKLLIDKDMTKTDLRKKTGISSSTIAKMVKGDDVTVSTLVRICDVLKCDIGDIMEVNSGEFDGISADRFLDEIKALSMKDQSLNLEFRNLLSTLSNGRSKAL